MAVAKVSTSGSLSDMKSEEGNDSLGTFIRQPVGKEPLLPLSISGDNPMQWIQLLNALDQPDLLAWPLMTPIKVQMQKCEKCSQEFCSPMNYRRHIRVHRRSLNVNKEFHKNRALLAAFWDKLPFEEAKEVVSFNEVMLKEFPGSAVITALAASLCKPAAWTLPQVYVRAGSSLLDIIQARPSSLKVSSEELFGILDAASERTFLCDGAPESVQKYLFDGEAAKACLELKNIIACTSFLFEQQLVKAWVVDKDAEALRCQKLLVEEEEAAKKRLAELLERKKQRRLRQKEHKLKEQFSKADLTVASGTADEPVLAEASGLPSPSDSSSNSTDGCPDHDSCSDPQTQNLGKDIEARIDFQSVGISQEDSETIEPHTVGEHKHLATNSTPVSNTQKMGPAEDPTLVNGPEIWPSKDQTESGVKCLEPPSLLGGIGHQMGGNNYEVIIGSISIPVNNCGTKPFSSVAAKEFLEQRWKEAVSEDHVQLALS